MTYFNHLLTRMGSLIHQLTHHPFHQKIKDGTLPLEIFKFYLKQDAPYLRDYSRALTRLAIRLPKEHHKEQLMRLVAGAISTERSIQSDYLRHLAHPSPYGFFSHHIPPVKIKPIKQYTKSILHSARNDPTPIAFARIMACPKLYQLWGVDVLLKDEREPLPSSDEMNIYQPWIDTYASMNYIMEIDKLETTFEEIASRIVDRKMQLAIEQALFESFTHELRFHDAVMNHEKVAAVSHLGFSYDMI